MRRWLTVSAAMVMAGSLQVAVSAAAENDREFYTGEALYQRCGSAPADPDYSTRHVACRAYVMGVSDALQAAQGVAGASPAICLGSAEAEPMVEQVSAYLVGHPEARHFAASDLIAAALKAAYPCRQPAPAAATP